MDITALLLGTVVVGVAVYLIAMPLVQPVEESLVPEVDLDELDPIEKEKESVFTTLGEIEFDYQMKKLSEDDYQSLQNVYRRQAVSILKEEEGVLKAGAPVLEKAAVISDIEKEIEAEIEAEVRRLRQQKKDR
ncbi:hypothetical protein SY88_09445 [Clostridiales bacterium PH28_bin88]|nr:hypothetical protein SY88_09445 [Clostridiales bacterium PH28_bin88]